MITQLLLSLAASAASATTTPVTQEPDAAAPPKKRDPRTQPLTVEDALFTIPEVTGKIVVVPDADGDGLADLVAERGGKRGAPERIELLSSRDGRSIAAWWTIAREGRVPYEWDAGGDVDGDGHADLLVGLPRHDESRGKVLVVSAATKEVVQETLGDARLDEYGGSISFVGDVNGDGHDDYAVGARRINRPEPAPTRGGNVRRTDRSHWQVWMQRRSTAPGYVSLRSGRDGSELWRASHGPPGHAFGIRVRRIGDLDGDGKPDLLAMSDLMSDQLILLLSGASGEIIAGLPHRLGWAGPVGDVDGDGVPDLHLDRQDEELVALWGTVQMFSGRTRKRLFEVSYPDAWTEYAVTVPMGDLDGDGIGDFAIGDGNFHLTGPHEAAHYACYSVASLREMPLPVALAQSSNPGSAFLWESGCALVYSGRARHVILGVWGSPGVRRGIGLEVAPMPDIDGDGHPDVLVADQDTAYVFSGPGPAPK